MWKMWRTRRKWGTFVLGVWLIATGALPLLNIQMPWTGTVLALLAIAAGTLILLDR